MIVENLGGTVMTESGAGVQVMSKQNYYFNVRKLCPENFKSQVIREILGILK